MVSVSIIIDGQAKPKGPALPPPFAHALGIQSAQRVGALYGVLGIHMATNAVKTEADDANKFFISGFNGLYPRSAFL